MDNAGQRKNPDAQHSSIESSTSERFSSQFKLALWRFNQPLTSAREDEPDPIRLTFAEVQLEIRCVSMLGIGNTACDSTQ